MSKTLTEQLALHSTNNGQDYTNIYPNQAWTLEEYKELYTMIGQGLLHPHPEYIGGYMLSRYAEDEADGVMWIGGEGEVMHAVWYTKEDYFSGGHYLTDKNDDNIEMINDWQDEHNVGGDPDSDGGECSQRCGECGVWSGAEEEEEEEEEEEVVEQHNVGECECKDCKRIEAEDDSDEEESDDEEVPKCIDSYEKYNKCPEGTCYDCDDAREESDDEDDEPSGVRECRVGMTRYLIDPLTRELYDHKVFMETGEAKFIAVLNKDQVIQYL